MIEIAAEPFDSPDSVALREELARELSERYGGDFEPGDKPTAEDVAVWVVAREEGRALGCGALRSLGEPVAEIKRMYVRREARGRGIGALVLGVLEREAVKSGFRVMRLETGPLQQDAVRLYERAGYREIPCFGTYASGVASRCFERRIA